MVTCYDAAFARLIDRTDVDMVLVGDSLGNVVLGYENTISVTMDDMVHHTKAVSRVLKRPFLVADMPFLSYKVSPEEALKNAGRLIQEGGAKAVKVEGGASIAEHVRRIVDAGIPVMGHLGLTPQSINKFGTYVVRATEDAEATKLKEDAQLLDKAGCFGIVLEKIPARLAKEVTDMVKIPVISM